MSTGKGDGIRVCSFDSCPTANHSDKVTCFTCKLESHVKCYELQKPSLKAVGGACNLQFICDTCLANYKPIGAQVSTMMESMSKKVTGMYNALAVMQPSLKALHQQHTEFEQRHQLELQRHTDQQQELQQKFILELQQQQHATNNLLEGIRTVLTENAAASLANEVSFKDDMKGFFAEIKSLMKTAPPIETNATPMSSGHRKVRNVQEKNTASRVPPHTPISDVHTATTHQNTESKAVVVSQLHPSITSDQLVQFVTKKLSLKSEHNNIIARALIPKGKTTADLNFVSILLKVPETIYESIISPTLWPQGAIVRDFEDRPRKPRPSGVFLEM